MKKKINICVIGLGYVGLPLAIEFGKKVQTIGFDVNKDKISNLKNFLDSNGEVKIVDFKKSKYLKFSNKINAIKKSNFYIVCVPTPVNKKNIPDLKLLKKACLTLSKVITKDDYVVFESTVYPGTTEEICVPLIKKKQNKNLKNDYFNYGYSPERINPGDKKNSLKKIYKVVSGSDAKSLDFIEKVYSLITNKIFKAKNIKVAESAKIIENCQRDINIAFMNELAVIFNNLNIDFKEILSAAKTKWNFLNFNPGLVGGHCIGVDPYYLAHKSKLEGYSPKIILAGRKINDGMAKFYSNNIQLRIKQKFKNIKDRNILILGLSFKENVNDIRNSKSLAIVDILKKKFKVNIHDPIVKKSQLNKIYHSLYIENPKLNFYDSVVLLVPHRKYLKIKFLKEIKKFSKKEFLIFDIKHVLNHDIFEHNLVRF